MVSRVLRSRKTIFIILVVIVVMVAVGVWFTLQHKPTGQVIFSIDRSVIKQDENTTLSVTVKNFDLKTHNVEYKFKVNPRVRIHEGAEKLLPRIGSEYLFNYTLEATDPSKTKAFVVIGTLEEGISSATYPISLSVYFDGEELEETWSDLILKVEE